MPRGYQAAAVDGWAALTHPLLRIEAERPPSSATMQQASLIPGVLYHEPVTAQQIGRRARERVRRGRSRAVGAGFDAGYASGDHGSPGFGAFPAVGARRRPARGPRRAQGEPAATTTRVNNFRFHPDYFIDRILFREIIGTVTGAVLPAPPRALGRHAHRARRAPGVASRGIASWAVFAENAPGGKRPSASRSTRRSPTRAATASASRLEYGVLFPLAGLDNPVAHLDAFPAQLAALRVMYRF